MGIWGSITSFFSNAVKTVGRVISIPFDLKSAGSDAVVVVKNVGQLVPRIEDCIKELSRAVRSATVLICLTIVLCTALDNLEKITWFLDFLISWKGILIAVAVMLVSWLYVKDSSSRAVTAPASKSSAGGGESAAISTSSSASLAPKSPLEPTTQ